MVFTMLSKCRSFRAATLQRPKRSTQRLSHPQHNKATTTRHRSKIQRKSIWVHVERRSARQIACSTVPTCLRSVPKGFKEFQNVPQDSPRISKRPPRPPQASPTASQETPRTNLYGQLGGHEGHFGTPRSPKASPRPPKMSPRAILG